MNETQVKICALTEIVEERGREIDRLNAQVQELTMRLKEQKADIIMWVLSKLDEQQKKEGTKS